MIEYFLGIAALLVVVAFVWRWVALGVYRWRDEDAARQRWQQFEREQAERNRREPSTGDPGHALGDEK